MNREAVMVRPHYVTRRVGDEYVLVRVDPVGHVGRVVTGGLGAMLISRGIRKGGLRSLFYSAAGASCLYHAFTGRDPLDLLFPRGKARHGEEKDSPSFPGEPESKQLPSDEVVQEPMESVPGRDPPRVHSIREVEHP